jgi:hypothetical protein
MAVKKIEFEDKVSTIESSLPVINRIRDVDCNEIKDVVNNNADELTTANTNIETINTKIGALRVYVSGWTSTITFTLPAGHIALVMSAQSALYQLWNPDDKLNVNAITGNDLSFTRAADKTTITGTRSGNTTWTILVL